MFNLDAETKGFINQRVRNMLAQKLRVDEKYKKYNNDEAELLEEITTSLSEQQRDMLEDYRNAVIDRETQGLYFAYLSGLKDGVTYKEATGAGLDSI